MVAGYWPIQDEIDVRPLLRRLADGGASLALPAVTGVHRRLAFRRWRIEIPLEPDARGIMAPAASAQPAVPELVIVPLLAFDATGFRLGYGGGFYDATLKALRAERPATVAIGVAFAEQRLDGLPHESHDQVLDAVVTDTEMIHFTLAARAMS